MKARGLVPWTPDFLRLVVPSRLARHRDQRVERFGGGAGVDGLGGQPNAVGQVVDFAADVISFGCCTPNMGGNT